MSLILSTGSYLLRCDLCEDLGPLEWDDTVLDADKVRDYMGRHGWFCVNGGAHLCDDCAEQYLVGFEVDL